MIFFFIVFGIAVLYHLASWQPSKGEELYKKKPLYFGHRGALLEKPENTMASFACAWQKNADAIEVDVVSAKDGQIVCSHNYDLERNTDGTGYIHQHNTNDLIHINVLGPGGNKEKICLLEDVLKQSPDNTIINIEIKHRQFFEINTPLRVVRLVKKHQLEGRVIVSSFNPLTILFIKWLSRKIHTGFIIETPELLPLVYLAKPDFLHPSGEMITAKLIAYAKRKNMRINAWTINTKPAMRWLESNSIDGIITDHLEFRTG